MNGDIKWKRDTLISGTFKRRLIAPLGQILGMFGTNLPGIGCVVCDAQRNRDGIDIGRTYFQYPGLFQCYWRPLYIHMIPT